MTARLLLALALLPAATATAEVYRWVDEQGTVHFSDEPPAAGAEPMPLKSPAVVSVPSPTQGAAQGSAARQGEDEAEGASAYKALEITAPSEGEIIFQTLPVVEVAFELSPALQVGADHRVAIVLDGEPVAETRNAGATIADVLPGPHTVAAQVLDAEGRRLIGSPPVSFFVRRRSAIAGPNPPGVNPPAVSAPAFPRAP